jgi:hypothetical protein
MPYGELRKITRYFGQRIIAPPKTAAENRRLRFD